MRLASIFALLHCFALLLVALPARAVPAASLADPRPASSLLDTTGTIKPEGREAIETAARDAYAAGLGELVVVVVASVDGAVPRAYATQLYNRWKIGGASSRGVLILAALGDRKAEIVLGDGVRGSAYVRESQSIMDGVMIPHFKRGDNEGAVVEGARACAERILGGNFKASASGATAPTSSSSSPSASSEASSTGLGVAGAVGGGGVLLGLVAIGRSIARRRPRKCSACYAPMVRLCEVSDDAHLTPAEQVEEQIGSVDYDVWQCRCGNTQKLRYGTFFTRYARCPQCSAVTKLRTETVLDAATEYSEGLAEIEERCAHCSYYNRTTRRIPRVTPSSSDSSSSSWDSGSSGGGSSSGDGASGSW